jgi:hypothetical protein
VTAWCAYPLADSLVLAGPPDRPLVVLNATARLIWECSAAGLGEAEIADGLARQFDLPRASAIEFVAQARAAWEQHLAAGAEAAETPTCNGAPSIAAALDAMPGRATRRVYELGGSTVAVTFSPPELEHLVHPRLAHAEKPEAFAPATITVASAGDGYLLDSPGAAIEHVASGSALLGSFTRRYVQSVYPASDWMAVLHAAAACDGAGRTVLLVGSNGAGKSTCVAGLTASGMDFLSDDCVPLREDGKAVPVPFAICLKEGSWRPAEMVTPALGEAPVHFLADGRRCRYVAPPRLASGPRRPSLLVFPRYVADEPVRIRPIDGAEAFTRLVGARAWVSREPECLRALLALVERLPAHEVVYGALGDGVTAIHDLLGSGAA